MYDPDWLGSVERPDRLTLVILPAGHYDSEGGGYRALWTDAEDDNYMGPWDHVDSSCTYHRAHPTRAEALACAEERMTRSASQSGEASR